MSKYDNKLTYWQKNLLPQFEERFRDVNEKIKIDENLIQIFNQSQEQLEVENKKYKNEFSSFKFFVSKLCLFLSVLLIFIPFYWSWKWYKQLRTKKEYHLSLIKEKEIQKLNVHQQIINSFDFIDFFNNFNNIINYKHMGPVPKSLIYEMQDLSLYEFDDYNKNSYKTSWGIFDNNKIIINKSIQTISQYMASYSGSITVYTYSRDKDGRTVRTPHIVTAHYSHPAFKIYDNRYSYTFMESCSNLEFSLESDSSKFSSKRFNKRNNFSPLENQEFEKNYNWYRNDDLQFRMIFTPYAQEAFLEEASALDRKSNVENQSTLLWNKASSFFYNQYNNSFSKFNYEYNLSNVLTNFSLKPKMSIIDLTNELYQIILDYYHNIYNSLNYIWLTTILQSEDHTSSIKSALNHVNDFEDPSTINLFVHHILTEILEVKIIWLDTDCFNKFENVEFVKNINNLKLIKAKMKGTSFSIIKKEITIPTMGPTGIVGVPVQYDDYIKDEDFGYVYGCYIVKDYFYMLNDIKVITNIYDNQTLDLISQISIQAKIVIKNKILAVYSKELINQEIDELIVQLIKRLSSI